MCQQASRIQWYLNYKCQPSVTEKRKTGCEPPKMEPEGEAYCLAGNRVSTDQAGVGGGGGGGGLGGASKQRRQSGFVQSQRSPGSAAVLMTSKIRVCMEVTQAAGWSACVRPRRTVAPTTDSGRGSQQQLASHGKQFKSQFPHL